MNLKKLIPQIIITHNGRFHADEISAVALLNVFHCFVWVWRTRNIKVLSFFKKIPFVFVLDVGREYDISRRNLDHHQDPNLQSSFNLMIKYMKKNGYDSKSLSFVEENIGQIIDSYDRGKSISKISEFENNLFDGFGSVYNVSQLIGIIKPTYENFYQSVFFMKLVLKGIIHKGNTINKIKLLLKRRKIENGTIVFAEGDNISYYTMREYVIKKNEPLDFMVEYYKNLIKVWAFDSETKPIPKSVKNIKGHKFLHNSGFLAEFDADKVEGNFDPMGF